VHSGVFVFGLRVDLLVHDTIASMQCFYEFQLQREASNSI
jgi:hypothetical protein